MLKIFLYIFLKLILSLYIYRNIERENLYRKRKFINNVIFDNIIYSTYSY